MADSTTTFGAHRDIGLRSIGDRSVPKTKGGLLNPSPPRRFMKALPFGFQRSHTQSINTVDDKAKS